MRRLVRRANRGSPGGGIRPALLACLAAILLMGRAGCTRPPSEPQQAEPRPAADASLVQLDEEGVRLAGIAVGEAESGKLQEDLEVPGRITANEDTTARVGSFAEGIAVACCQSVGTDVQEGQVLARLHSHETHDAEASYWQARAELARTGSDLRFAEEFFNRATRLYDLKAGSLRQVQEAEAHLRSAEAIEEISRADVQRAEEHLAFLGLDPADLPVVGTEHRALVESGWEGSHLIDVRSPITGTVIERSVSLGAVVGLSDALYVISDLRTLWVIAEVPEQHLSRLRRGLAVEVSVRAFPGKAFPARITYIGDALDPETRTVDVRCEMPNPGRQLKMEMFATVTIRAADSAQSVMVPLTALQNLDGADVVFVPEGKRSFRARRVDVGRRLDSAAEILSGVLSGDPVVVAGAFRLKSELLKDRMIEE